MEWTSVFLVWHLVSLSTTSLVPLDTTKVAPWEWRAPLNHFQLSHVQCLYSTYQCFPNAPASGRADTCNRRLANTSGPDRAMGCDATSDRTTWDGHWRYSGRTLG